MRNDSDNNIAQFSIGELRQQWAQLWGKKAHSFIRRPMLEKSIRFKQAQLRGEGLSVEQQTRLNQLIKQYKRDPSSLDQKNNGLTQGSHLVRIWQGRKCVVTVKDKGFEYNDKIYKSLSQVAFVITGTSWNGWTFFGLKKKGQVKNEAVN
jgi:hypothetical protein